MTRVFFPFIHSFALFRFVSFRLSAYLLIRTLQRDTLFCASRLKKTENYYIFKILTLILSAQYHYQPPLSN